jgi:hypothetical protein
VTSRPESIPELAILGSFPAVAPTSMKLLGPVPVAFEKASVAGV